MFTSSELILGRGALPRAPLPLFDKVATRQLETQCVAGTDTIPFMQRAGLAIAQLALAMAPHARTVWVACGPGNNGGDGFEAALHLHRWGRHVIVSALANHHSRSPESAEAFARAVAAGIAISTQAPDHFDLCIDALYGMGKSEGLSAECVGWIALMNSSRKLVLAVDGPTGLNLETGAASIDAVRADATLSLLTLKPGLFTGDGRAFSGDVWFHALHTQPALPPCAHLAGSPIPSLRVHNTHKGTYGDVAVVGGDTGMLGAAVLAARAALAGGAGRVYLGFVGDNTPALDSQHPEIMVRPFSALPLDRLSVVAGCGGGAAIAKYLMALVQRAQSLVLDADALNHLALAPDIQQTLKQRKPGTTVITPHPLEAARLLATSVIDVQKCRLLAAQELAQRWQCTVVLKGSGTVIAVPDAVPCINPTGNARLATAGTGDVLAGLIGSYLANGQSAQDAAQRAVFRHGQVADLWPDAAGTLTADRLVQRL